MPRQEAIMSITVEAVYEAGMLKPLSPLPELAEHSRVRVTIEPASKAVPKVRRSSRAKIDLSKEREWVRQHKDEYRGQWVVLDGDRLVGHTADANEATALFKQARQAGVRSPYVKFIPFDDEPIWMGWL
jgi:predicted DNA-binding antitoxin AbrB/MazE fold protein